MTSELYLKGFSKRERAKVDEIFASDYNMPETSVHPKGLEKTEIEARIKWLQENKSKHSFSDNRIKEIEDSLINRL